MPLVRLPSGRDELLEMTGPGGLDLEDLTQVLEVELTTSRRFYVVLRLVQRINKLRSEAFTTEIMGRLAK